MTPCCRDYYRLTSSRQFKTTQELKIRQLTTIPPKNQLDEGRLQLADNDA
jgi:hypothetical protein